MMNIINTTNQSHVSFSHADMLMLLLSVLYLFLVSDVSKESSASAVDMVEGGGGRWRRRIGAQKNCFSYASKIRIKKANPPLACDVEDVELITLPHIQNNRNVTLGVRAKNQASLLLDIHGFI